MTKAKVFLKKLNSEYLALHTNYEELFWQSYMGDQKVDVKKDKALEARDAFRSNVALQKQAKELLITADAQSKNKLKIWIDFFDLYLMPEEARVIKNKCDALESEVVKKRAIRIEGYVDPYTKLFTEASSLRMRTMMQTHADEKVRKACFEAREKIAVDCIDQYVELVKLRNEFARVQGFSDFYDYKLQKEDKMTKKQLFSLFDSISLKTKKTFVALRELENSLPALRKPWNFGYFMTGDFTKEEDQYFQFEDALQRWGRSFSALGITFKKGTLQLDLLDRKRKYNNGFCHWPVLVNYDGQKRNAGSSNFTCTLVAGQVGAGSIGYKTLFHEGGHAAHFLNIEQTEVCLNHEYAPQSGAWSETQSMFLDTMFSSIEWKTRYAKNSEGTAYPFVLFTRKEKKLHLLKPEYMNSIMFVSNFEKEVYELKIPTAKQICAIAKANYKKYYDLSGDSFTALNVPHIYSWESSASYHNYGLEKLALAQWREYFYKKYGYIVDNPNVGREMAKVWKLGALKSFQEFVLIATGKKLGTKAFLDDILMPVQKVIKEAQVKIECLKHVKEYTKPVALNGNIKMVHGKKVIATNEISFEAMAEQYGKWLKKMEKKSKKS